MGASCGYWKEKVSDRNKKKYNINIETTDQGDAWHKAGIENGGTSIEEEPGIRDYGKFKMYLAYLRDPTGNKLCAGLLIK